MDQFVHLLRLALNAETDTYESGQNAVREPCEEDQAQIGRTGAERMNTKQVLDEQVCTKTSAPHADTAEFCEFLSHQIVWNRPQSKPDNAATLSQARRIRIGHAENPNVRNV